MAIASSSRRHLFVSGKERPHLVFGHLGELIVKLADGYDMSHLEGHEPPCSIVPNRGV